MLQISAHSVFKINWPGTHSSGKDFLFCTASLCFHSKSFQKCMPGCCFYCPLPKKVWARVLWWNMLPSVSFWDDQLQNQRAVMQNEKLSSSPCQAGTSNSKKLNLVCRLGCRGLCYKNVQLWTPRSRKLQEHNSLTANDNSLWTIVWVAMTKQ